MRKLFLILGSVALVGFVFVSSANAQLVSTWDDKSYLTFSGAVSLPGVTLPAGTYLFRFPSRQTARSVIQVLSGDRKIVYAMMQTIPTTRFGTSHEPEVTFMEARTGEPPAIRALFQPHRRTGYEFMYPSEPAGTGAQASPGTGSKQVAGEPADWLMNAWRGKAAPPHAR